MDDYIKKGLPDVRPFPDTPIKERREQHKERDETIADMTKTNISDKLNEQLDHMYGPRRQQKKKD